MFVTSTGEDHESVSWYLVEFVFGKDLTVEDHTTIFVDRATHEFGFVFYLDEVAVVAQFPDTDEPAFFSAKDALAACWHSKSRKVTILLLQQIQISLKFSTSSEARAFLDAFEDAAATAHNMSFSTYEHHSLNKFSEKSFDMVKEQCAGRVVQPWMNVHHKPSSEWPSLRKSGEWSDFTIIAGGRSFAVHRVKLCKESEYFRAICKGNFAESNSRSVKLPESAQTIDLLLDEMYGVYNSTTGSLFTGFALRSEMEKERLLNDLLGLFIAADKYALEEVKTKAARAIVDRIQFVEDPLTLVDLGTSIFDEQCPQVDRGLRKAITGLLCIDRMPAIMNNQAAWKGYTENMALLRAVHLMKFPNHDKAGSRAVDETEQLATPPETPTGVKRKRSSRNS